MRPRILMVIVAAITLLLRTACLCAADAPACSSMSCAAHQHEGSCPDHDAPRKSHRTHECCQAAACRESAQARADAASPADNYLSALPLNFVSARIFESVNTANLRLITQVHSRPPAVSAFLATHALLL